MQAAVPIRLLLAGGRMAAMWLVAAALLLAFAPAATGQDPETSSPAPSPAANAPADSLSHLLEGGPNQWLSREHVNSSLQVVLLLAVLSLAPAILLMTTSFVRIVVVLGLLKQALGTQQLPPSQVMTALALFMTLLVMTPTWTEVYRDSIGPYSRGEIQDAEEAWNRGVMPIKRFMSRQIEMAGNRDDVWLFYDYIPESQRASEPPATYDEVPLAALLPAFMLSELKVAFLIGFQIFLPFLILDLVVSSVTISMGMMMLPPMTVSLPLKLLLFVLADGWNLIVGMLLESFGPP